MGDIVKVLEAWEAPIGAAHFKEQQLIFLPALPALPPVGRRNQPGRQ